MFYKYPYKKRGETFASPLVICISIIKAYASLIPTAASGLNTP